MLAADSRTNSRTDAASFIELRSLLSGEIVHLYQNNPFRVLNLPANTTLRQAEKRVQRLNVLRQIGQKAADEFAVREAMQTLRDPQRRLLAELFWFTLDTHPASLDQQAMQKLREGNWVEAREIWGKVARKTPSDDTQRAVHNLAVLLHARVVTLEAGKNPLLKHMTGNAPLPADVLSGWHEALQMWSDYWRDETAWNYWRERVRAASDRRIGDGFVGELRELLPEALLQVNRDLARRYADAGFGAAAGAHCRLMQQSGFSSQLAVQHARTVIDPIRKRLTSACDELKQNAQTQTNGSAIMQLLGEFGRNSIHDIQLLTQIDEKKEFGAASAREVIARSLKTVAIQFISDGKRAFQPCIETLQKAERFADSQMLRNELREALQSVEYQKRVWALAPRICIFSVCGQSPVEWTSFSNRSDGLTKLVFLCKRHAAAHNEEELVRLVNARWRGLPLAPPEPRQTPQYDDTFTSF